MFTTVTYCFHETVQCIFHNRNRYLQHIVQYVDIKTATRDSLSLVETLTDIVIHKRLIQA